MATLKQLREDTYLKIANRYYFDVNPEDILETLKRRYAPATIDRFLNEAQDFVCREARCLYGQFYGTVAIDKYWIKLPSKCLDVLDVYWKEPDEDEVKLVPRSQKQLDEDRDDWERGTDDSDTNMPEEYMMLQEHLGTGAGHSIKLRPRPDVEGVLRVYCIRLGNVMTDSVNCSFDDYWYQAVIDFAVYKAGGNVKDIQELGVLVRSMRGETKSKHTDAKRFIKSPLPHRG